MPTIIDRGDSAREDLCTFILKHLPNRLFPDTLRGKPPKFWKQGQITGTVFYFEDAEENTFDAAEIKVDQPNTIVVCDRSYLRDFTELAEQYEKYNPQVLVTIEVRKSE